MGKISLSSCPEKFIDYLTRWDVHLGTDCIPPTTGEDCITVLWHYLLDEVPIADSCGGLQGNTLVTHKILMKHSRKYRKDYLKKKLEHLRKLGVPI